MVRGEAAILYTRAGVLAGRLGPHSLSCPPFWGRARLSRGGSGSAGSAPGLTSTRAFGGHIRASIGDVAPLVTPPALDVILRSVGAGAVPRIRSCWRIVPLLILNVPVVQSLVATSAAIARPVPATGVESPTASKPGSPAVAVTACPGDAMLEPGIRGDFLGFSRGRGKRWVSCHRPDCGSSRFWVI